MFPTAVAPEPVLGLAADVLLEMASVGAGDVALGEGGGLVGKEGEVDEVAAAAELADVVEDDGHVVFASEMLGAEEEGGVDAEEGGPEAFEWVAGALVGEHHVGDGDMVVVVVLHDVADVGLVDDLGAEAGTAGGDEATEFFV